MDKHSGSFLFGLGFGFKYQYLIAFLIYYLIEKKNSIFAQSVNNTLKKEISRSKINANSKKFLKDIQGMFSQFNTIEYKKNSLLMLEGEDGFFEDINIFIEDKTVLLVQVKGEDGFSENLRTTIFKAYQGFIKNKNISINSREELFYVIVNKKIDNIYSLKNSSDRSAIAIRHCSRFFKAKSSKSILEHFIDECIINNKGLVFDELIDTLIDKNKKNREIALFKKVYIANLQEIEKAIYIAKYLVIYDFLNYRLVYHLLVEEYTKSIFLEKQWNIEMTSMNGEWINNNTMVNNLRSIGFNNDKALSYKYTKASYGLNNNCFNIGKVL